MKAFKPPFLLVLAQDTSQAQFLGFGVPQLS